MIHMCGNEPKPQIRAPLDSQTDRIDLPDGTDLPRGISMQTLIAMKEAAGREQDRIDIEHLRMRLEDDAGQ